MGGGIGDPLVSSAVSASLLVVKYMLCDKLTCFHIFEHGKCGAHRMCVCVCVFVCVCVAVVVYTTHAEKSRRNTCTNANAQTWACALFEQHSWACFEGAGVGSLQKSLVTEMETMAHFTY